MPLKRCQLRGDNVRSLASFYAVLGAQLGFPPTFGRNLDALYDVLSRDIKGPVEIVWSGVDASSSGMGQDFPRVLAVLRQIEMERSDFRVRIT